MEKNSGIEKRDEFVKSSIVRACFKVRVDEVPFYVPFGQLESFLKMALSARNNIEIFSSENTDLSLV